MAEPLGISPYGLLQEREMAEEVLALSFTTSLEFFERFALAAARNLSARVTLLSDATGVHGDPTLVRGAGRTYLDGRTAVEPPAVFHPKLLVIAGEGNATAAVGSGNVTLGGWHGNAEIWTAIRGDSDVGGPATLHQIGDWLEGLESHFRLSPGVNQRLQRVAQLLREVPVAKPGPEFVASTDGPLLERLPEGPTDELTVHAPFFDRRLDALTALVDRLRPSAVRVYVQRQTVEVDGRQLAAFIQQVGGDIREVAASRYHHGKLIEWRVGRDRFALTGSPNLSVAALGRTLSEGGNCEIGLIAQVPDSLAPSNGSALSMSALKQVTLSGRDRAVPGIIVLGACRVAGGIDLALRNGLADAGVLEVNSEGIWKPIAVVDSGEPEVFVPVEALPQAGAALRLVSDAGLSSSEFFLTDLAQVHRRPHKAQGRAMTTPVEIFRDLAQAELFQRDLQLLRIELADTGEARTRGSERERSSQRSPSGASSMTLADYLDLCASIVGDRMMRFGLGLPTLGGLSEEGAVPDESSEGEVEGENGASEPPAEPPPPEPEFIRSEKTRLRYQRWCERLADVSADLVPLGRVIALRLILRAVGNGLWRESGEWTRLVIKATESLAALDQGAQDEERRAAASLSAVALAALRTQIRQFTRADPLIAEFDHLSSALAETLAVVDAKRVDEFGGDLIGTLGPGLTTPSVLELAESIRHPPSPVDRAISLLSAEHGLSVRREGTTIAIESDAIAAAQRAVILAVGVAEEVGPVAARGRTDGAEVIALWDRPQLVIIRRSGAMVWGSVHEIGSGMSPRIYALEDIELPRRTQAWSGPSPPSNVEHLLASCNLSRSVLEPVGAGRSDGYVWSAEENSPAK